MFTLTLVTPEKMLLAGAEIEEVFVPAYRGELNILPGHAPLLTTLSTGVLRYRLKGESRLHYVAVSAGYMQVNPKGVSVLAEMADRPEDIDVDEVQQEERDAEARIASEAIDPEMLVQLQEEVARSHARREVATLGYAE